MPERTRTRTRGRAVPSKPVVPSLNDQVLVTAARRMLSNLLLLIFRNLRDANSAPEDYQRLVLAAIGQAQSAQLPVTLHPDPEGDYVIVCIALSTGLLALPLACSAPLEPRDGMDSWVAVSDFTTRYPPLIGDAHAAEH